MPRHRLNGCRSILQDRFKIQSNLVENYQCLTPEKALNVACSSSHMEHKTCT